MTNTPASVPKPSPAGEPRYAIALTRMAFANVRSGPATRYRDTADLRNNTPAVYYPDTRTTDGWVWVEQGNASGWVSTNVVTFEDIITSDAAESLVTPFDGQIALWHESGDHLPSMTLSAYALSLKQAAPNLSQVWVKVCDWSPQAGAQWMGYWDTRRALAIDRAESIDAWVNALAEHSLSFCAWAAPRCDEPDAEAELIGLAAERQGVKALILHLEPKRSAWANEPIRIERFLSALAETMNPQMHIGISFSMRDAMSSKLWLGRWSRVAASLHPRVLWRDARKSPSAALESVWQQFGSVDKPIIPSLQGDAPPLEIREAETLAAFRYKARGLSFWRAGTIHPGAWNAIRAHSWNNKDVKTSQVPVFVGHETVIRPNEVHAERRVRRIEPKTHTHFMGWESYAAPLASNVSSINMTWTPKLPASGLYEIAVFIPMRHASAREALYTIQAREPIRVMIDQSVYRSQWVTLAVAELDIDAPNAGRVTLSNLGKGQHEIAFDAVRWRQIVKGSPKFVADGYDMPVGTPTERRSRTVWGGEWLDASPFGKLYFVGTHDEAYHTGADLNLPQNADAHNPVMTAASGVVTFAARLPAWGNVIVIRHDPLATDGMVLYGRYAHVERMRVKVGDRVERGQVIAHVGDAFGRWAYLLHFDLSPTTILETNPGHWGRTDREAVFKHYLDPREFISANRPI